MGSPILIIAKGSEGVLNKPKFMKPSTNKEECTIDVAANNIPFSCIVDGNEAITAWQIVIYDILDDSEVFKTDEIHLEPSFYPVDEKNRNVVFHVNLKEYIPGDNDKFVNRADAYYWTITLRGSSGNSVTSYQEVFYANKTPTIRFSYNGNDVDLGSETAPELNSKECTFKAELDFGDNENEYRAQLKRYGWRITDSSNEQVLVDTITKNQIYGSADNIICKYNGFLNGGNYSVELYVETQNNTKITSSFEISVSYVATFLSNGFNVETLKNEPAIMLDWSKSIVIAGILKDVKDGVIAVDDTTFKTNYPVYNQCSIEIPDEHKVVYSDEESLNFDVDENACIAFSTQLLSRDDARLFAAEGTVERNDDGSYYEVSRELWHKNGVFIYEIRHGGDLVASDTHIIKNKPSEYVWYNIFMSPLIDDGAGGYVTELNVYEGSVVNCIYPSIDLYPMAETAWDEAGSSYFYPIFGDWSNSKAVSDDTGTEG